MAYGQVVLWGLVIIATWVIIAQFTKSPRQTTWRLAQSAGLGFALMFVMNWLTPYTHVGVPFNSFTALLTGVLGAPGVVAATAIKLLAL